MKLDTTAGAKGEARIVTLWGGKRHGPHLWIGVDKGGQYGKSLWASLSDRRQLRKLARRILRDLDATRSRRRARR